ncbi:cytochrome P450 2C42-like [Ruditapes philippinarum]|uniref:cytochrome P450 2C42-like n=1 Tax=Ruditapes philippinarum TaxID=129788 RepID=UPI00295B6502|nr:cytochrome P450 2C42-like [Ruditapes philippinarum]
MDALVYVGLTLLILVYLFKTKKPKGKPIPGPSGWPLVGSAFEITEQNMPQKCFEYAKEFGPIVQLKLFNTNVVLLNSVDMLQKAMNGDTYKQFFNDRPGFFYGEHFLFGSQGVIVYKEGFGGVHSELRKTLTRGLHVYGDGIKHFEDMVAKELQNLMKKIEDMDNEEFDFMDTIKPSLSNLLSILLIGESLEESDADIGLFWEFDKSLVFMYSPKADAVYSTFPFVRYLPGIYKEQYNKIVVTRRRIIERYYTKVKDTHEPGNTCGLIHFLLEERNKELNNGSDKIVLTEERIISIVLEMVAAAVVTTMCSLSSTILCLMSHPEVQQKLQKEIDDVIGRDRRPTLDDRAKCKYIDAVAMEVQRLITIIPLSGPHICKPNIQFEGYDIPANSMVLPNLNFIHHDEKIWGPDAWKFKPERFLDVNGDIVDRGHPYRRNWVPFSIGRRQCLGDTFSRSRMFLFTATLFQRWNFVPSTGRFGSCDTRSEDFEVNLATRPKEFYCKVQRRN